MLSWIATKVAIFLSRNLLLGMASCLDLGGRLYNPTIMSDEEAWESDWNAVIDDWNTVVDKHS